MTFFSHFLLNGTEKLIIIMSYVVNEKLSVFSNHVVLLLFGMLQHVIEQLEYKQTHTEFTIHLWNIPVKIRHTHKK